MIESTTAVSPKTVKITFAKSSADIRSSVCVSNLRRYSGGLDFAPPKIEATEKEYGLEFKFEIPKDAKIFGLGEKTGYLNKAGQKFEMYNRDTHKHHEHTDPLYLSIPFFIIFDKNHKTGYFFDNPARQKIDLKNGVVKIYDNYADVFIIRGSIKEILEEYTELTGRTPIPPDWSLGFMQSRYSYESEKEVLDVAAGFETCGLPLSAIFIDIDYMQDFQVFTWNKQKFPAPEAMTKLLKEKGIEPVLIIDAGVCIKSKFYKKNRKHNIFCTVPSRFGKKIYKGVAWAEEIAYPDFSMPETAKIWGQKLKELKKMGVSGFWNDMNEPADFLGEGLYKNTVPDELSLGGYTFKENRNAYGYFMAKATYEQVGGFILTRSGYAGIQKYASVWTGDNYSSWENLRFTVPMCLNLGLSGVPFCGVDIGGFQSNASPELYARWLELGAFLPLYRAHSNKGTASHEPWCFGLEVLEIARKYLNFRKALIPYIKSCFEKSAKTGEPIMRPLFWDFEDDLETYNVEDQFMFGEKLLVAPVLAPSVRKRMVYLPKGLWQDIESKENHISKGEYIIFDAPLSKIPVFQKL
ncbi:glycoside hydrolase family 31 protein [Treponema sp. R6D11]